MGWAVSRLFTIPATCQVYLRERSAQITVPDGPSTPAQQGRRCEPERYNPQAIGTNQHSLYPNISWGNKLTKANRLDRIADACQSALPLALNNSVVRGWLVSAYKEQGKIEQAKQVFNGITGQQPNYPDAYCALGEVLQEKGQVDQAEECYNQALSLRADHAESLINLAVIKQKQGHMKEAGDPYAKILEVKEGYKLCTRPPVEKCAGCGKQGDAIAVRRCSGCETIRYCSRACQSTDWPRHKTECTAAAGAAGGADGAREPARQETRRAPATSNPQAKGTDEHSLYPNINWGNKLTKANRLDRIADACQSALPLAPNNSVVCQWLANAYKKQGKIEQAKQVFNGITGQQPNYPDAYCALGEVLQEKGQVDQAEECYNQALSLQAGHAKSLYGLAAIKEIQGHKKEANDLRVKAILYAENNKIRAIVAGKFLHKLF